MGLKNLKVLIVDDEVDIQNSLSLYLKKHDIEVHIAIDGQEGLDKYVSVYPQVIISDIRMPKIDGVELLKQIKSRNNAAKVILMTGFNEILETKTAFDLGADDFLAKPFKMKELLLSITRCLEGEKVDGDNLDKNFHGLLIDEFIDGSRFEIPIYVRLSSKKFVKLAQRGVDIPQTRIEAFRQKGIKELYLIKSDYERYVDKARSAVSAIQDSGTQIDEERKIKIIEFANNVIMENIFHQDLNQELFEESSKLMNLNIVEITKSDDLFNLINVMVTRSEKLYAHSVAVAMSATLISKNMDWITDRTLYRVSMGGLFHDIGKKNIPESILNKDQADLTFEEIKEFEKHSLYGSNILQSIPGVPYEV
ncbi:MAG: response regulator, partial [Pseudomonadota bacterium]